MRTFAVGFGSGILGAVMAVGLMGAVAPPGELVGRSLDIVNEKGASVFHVRTVNGRPILLLYDGKTKGPRGTIAIVNDSLSLMGFDREGNRLGSAFEESGRLLIRGPQDKPDGGVVIP